MQGCGGTLFFWRTSELLYVRVDLQDLKQIMLPEEILDGVRLFFLFNLVLFTFEGSQTHLLLRNPHSVMREYISFSRHVRFWSSSIKVLWPVWLDNAARAEGKCILGGRINRRSIRLDKESIRIFLRLCSDSCPKSTYSAIKFYVAYLAMWIVQSRQLLFHSDGVSLDKVSYTLQITDVKPEIRRMRGILPFFSKIVQHKVSIVQGEHFVNNSYFTLR